MQGQTGSWPLGTATGSLTFFLSFSFYKSNYVQRFHYSRPVRKGTVDPENEFAVSISPALRNQGTDPPAQDGRELDQNQRQGNESPGV